MGEFIGLIMIPPDMLPPDMLSLDNAVAPEATQFAMRQQVA